MTQQYLKKSRSTEGRIHVVAHPNLCIHSNMKLKALIPFADSTPAL